MVFKLKIDKYAINEWFQFWLPSIILFLLIKQDFKVSYDALELNKDKYTQCYKCFLWKAKLCVSYPHKGHESYDECDQAFVLEECKKIGRDTEKKRGQEIISLI